MRMKLTQTERDQLYEVADVEGREDVKNALGPRPRAVTIEDEAEIQKVRDLAAQCLEVGVPERYGFDKIENIYEKGNEVLFR